MPKKPQNSLLKPIEENRDQNEAKIKGKIKGEVQTLRMGEKAVEALRLASFTRRMTKNEIVLRALCSDLGIPYDPPTGREKV